MPLDYEREAESFLTEIEREEYLNGAGLKETYDIAPIYERHSALFDRANVEEVLAARRSCLTLADFAARGCLNAGVKDLTEQIENAETQARILWDGEEVPYRKASVLIANEPDTARRHTLESLRQDVPAGLIPDRQSRLARVYEGVESLGFDGYVEMCDELRGLNLSWVAEQMERLLEVTRAEFAAQLAGYLQRIGVPRDEATSADITYLFRAPRFDSLFPPGKLVPTLKRTLSGLGIDLDSQGNIELDVESRPLKSPRAFCAPVNVPDEVKLVISPRGGPDDYSALLHEAGHAEHFGSVDPSLPFAARRLGDNSVTEAYAFLFDNLMHSPVWLESVPGLDTSDELVQDFLRAEMFNKVYILRRYAAKLRYEIGLHSGSFDDPAAAYSRLLSKATMVKCSPKVYLADVDDYFYSSQYIRAWIFEVQLRRYLEGRFGNNWFARREAGDFLIGLWRQGQAHSADELARQLGCDGLDAGPLMAELAV